MTAHIAYVYARAALHMAAGLATPDAFDIAVAEAARIDWSAA